MVGMLPGTQALMTNTHPARVLVIDDEALIRWSLAQNPGG